jgi:RNA polymerase sigma factor (sigma-70 family)
MEDENTRLKEAFEQVAPGLFAYAGRCGLHRADAQDLVADVFLVASRKMQRVAHGEERLWLFGVANNLIRKHYRLRSRDHRLIERLQTSNGLHELTSTPADEWLRLAVWRLPRPEREVVELVAWQQLSHEEAGIILDCSANASRIRYHRAKQRLIDMLNQGGKT